MKDFSPEEIYDLIQIIETRPVNRYDNTRIIKFRISREIFYFEIPAYRLIQFAFDTRYNYDFLIVQKSMEIRNTINDCVEYWLFVKNKDRSTDYEFAAWPHFKLSI